MNSIKSLRLEKGLTQSELANLLNIPKRTIENWESGIRIPKSYVLDEVLEKIRKYEPNLVCHPYKEHHFLRVAAATLAGKTNDVAYNVSLIKGTVSSLIPQGVEIVVFPELSLTGSGLGDFFFQNLIHEQISNGLTSLLDFSLSHEIIMIIGTPLRIKNFLYNVGVIILKGKILGIVPKTHLTPAETKFFNSDAPKSINIKLFDQSVPFGNGLIFESTSGETFAIEIGDDLLAITPPSSNSIKKGAQVIFNPASFLATANSNETIKASIKNQSQKGQVAYVLTNASIYNSYHDIVFSGGTYIFENGIPLSIGERFFNVLQQESRNYVVNDLDLDLLGRAKNQALAIEEFQDRIIFQIKTKALKPEFINTLRVYPSDPFLQDLGALKTQEEIINIMTSGVIKRILTLAHPRLLIGISGGLDSTLALLILVRACQVLKDPLTKIIGVTMPAFGTSSRTYQNALKLMKLLKIESREIDLTKEITLHLQNIGHDLKTKDIAYENAQARERTRVLMDLANMVGGIVIGTGDLSEIALGWCTYGGDHLSMYHLCSGVPKTLIPSLIKTLSQNDPELIKIIEDIIDTPISPELTPESQATETILGPYLVHDFFLYHLIKSRYSLKKLFYLATRSFCLEPEVLKTYLKTFVKRFLENQFKRIASPEGCKISEVNITSLRDFSLSSDIKAANLLKEIEAFKS
ncbi:MAG: NAD(+) synthase [Erysipelotrichaceae bacterium]|jgi:NAD+ synthase (glutamine-hydrolysing)|nr:NAD(+) synthase [Erysipelotrichaceae bacterium]